MHHGGTGVPALDPHSPTDTARVTESLSLLSESTARKGRLVVRGPSIASGVASRTEAPVKKQNLKKS